MIVSWSTYIFLVSIFSSALHSKPPTCAVEQTSTWAEPAGLSFPPSSLVGDWWRWEAFGIRVSPDYFVSSLKWCWARESPAAHVASLFNSVAAWEKEEQLWSCPALLLCPLLQLLQEKTYDQMRLWCCQSFQERMDAFIRCLPKIFNAQLKSKLKCQRRDLSTGFIPIPMLPSE